MQYPLQMRFKILGFAPQIFINDSNGADIFYVKQKLFKLKEAVKVYKTSQQNNLLYEINADRIIDFSARYHFRDADGQSVGSVGRQGMRSLFRASYEVYSGDDKVMTIKEESVTKRVLEKLFGGIPLIGFIVILLINPSYIIQSASGENLLRLNKLPAFFQGKFSIDKLKETLSEQEERQALLSIMMLSLLERTRG